MSKDKVQLEYWLDIATPYGDPCDFIHTEDPYKEAKRLGTHPCISATNIHVILKSEYDQLLARTNRLVEALQFYAQARNDGLGAWAFRKKFMFDMIDESDLEAIGEKFENGRRYIFGGKRAREAIAEFKQDK